MEILTTDNFVQFAERNYDNPHCFNEDEFQSDLRRISTIKRMISWTNTPDDTINTKLLINNVILFYNVFDHKAASKLLEFKMDEKHYMKLNSILYFLSLPLVYDCSYDILFHRRIVSSFKNV